MFIAFILTRRMHNAQCTRGDGGAVGVFRAHEDGKTHGKRGGRVLQRGREDLQHERQTIYGCTVTAVATSDTGIEHYVTLSYDVNIPPYQSIYVTVERNLVRQIDTKTKVVSETSSHIPGSSVTSSTSSSSSSTSTTSTTASVTDSNEEKDWNKSSVRIVDYFFN